MCKISALALQSGQLAFFIHKRYCCKFHIAQKSLATGAAFMSRQCIGNVSISQHIREGTFPSKANIFQKYPHAASTPVTQWDAHTVTLLEMQVSSAGTPLTGEIRWSQRAFAATTTAPNVRGTLACPLNIPSFHLQTTLVLKAFNPTNSNQFEIGKVTRKLTSFFMFSGSKQKKKKNLKLLSLEDN